MDTPATSSPAQPSEEQLDAWRRSGIRLDRDGRFMHEGAEVTHPGLRAALYRWLDRDAEGRYILRLDATRFVWLEVDDAPFVVRSLRFEDDRAYALLSDRTEAPLDLATLHYGSDGVSVYARVRDGRFPARLASAAWGALAGHIDDDDGAVVVTRSGRYRIGSPRSTPVT